MRVWHLLLLSENDLKPQFKTFFRRCEIQFFYNEFQEIHAADKLIFLFFFIGAILCLVKFFYFISAYLKQLSNNKNFEVFK